MSRKDSIQLHPKYGVNPSLMVCILCGEPTGVAMLGNAVKGEAPHKGVYDLEPCSGCYDKHLADGVMLVECDSVDGPTGNVVVIKDEAFAKVFTIPIPPKRIALVDCSAWSRLIGRPGQS